MPKYWDDDRELVAAERDVKKELGDLDLDLASLFAVSNIFRVATAVRKHMEGTVLAEYQLSWSAFTVLFVLRVWGDHESGQLADEAGITSGTLTGVVTTLERRGLVERREHEQDRRRVVVSATPAGRDAVEAVMPAFNRHESLVTGGLRPEQVDQLAQLLRTVLRTVDEVDDDHH